MILSMKVFWGLFQNENLEQESMYCLSAGNPGVDHRMGSVLWQTKQLCHSNLVLYRCWCRSSMLHRRGGHVYLFCPMTICLNGLKPNLIMIKRKKEPLILFHGLSLSARHTLIFTADYIVFLSHLPLDIFKRFIWIMKCLPVKYIIRQPLISSNSYQP